MDKADKEAMPARGPVETKQAALAGGLRGVG